MSLNPPNSGLRAVHHNAVSASKVSLSIPAGDTLMVSHNVAEQLLASANEFQSVAVAEPAPVVKKSVAKKSAAQLKD